MFAPSGFFFSGFLEYEDFFPLRALTFHIPLKFGSRVQGLPGITPLLITVFVLPSVLLFSCAAANSAFFLVIDARLGLTVILPVEAMSPPCLSRICPL